VILLNCLGTVMTKEWMDMYLTLLKERNELQNCKTFYHSTFIITYS
jgi:hypothetical protein